MRWAELDEIVIVPAHRARRFADGLDFNPRNRWQCAGEQLVLDFARDGDFVLQALVLVSLLDELVDRTRHIIERFGQNAKLVRPLDGNAMRQVSGLDKLRGFIQIGDRPRNAPRQYNAGSPRHRFD